MPKRKWERLHQCDPLEMIDKKELARILHVSVRTLDEKYRHTPGFPVPRKVPGAKTLLWFREEMRRYLNGCFTDVPYPEDV